MTVYKTFFKVVNKYKFLILIYTVMLILFAGFNMQTSQNSTNFVAEKPDVLIINNDTYGHIYNRPKYRNESTSIYESFLRVLSGDII